MNNLPHTKIKPKEGLIYSDLPAVHGQDCSRQSFAFPPLHLDVQVPRSTGRVRAAIRGGQRRNGSRSEILLDQRVDGATDRDLHDNWITV